MMEKQGIEIEPGQDVQEKVAKEKCSHPQKYVKSEGEGNLKVFFCEKCGKYLASSKGV